MALAREFYGEFYNAITQSDGRVVHGRVFEIGSDGSRGQYRLSDCHNETDGILSRRHRFTLDPEGNFFFDLDFPIGVIYGGNSFHIAYPGGA